MANASDPPQEPGGDAPRDPWVGRSLGARDRYRILRRLGEGGFGTAYLAQDAHFAAAAGRTHHVVVKIPHAERRGARQPDAGDRWRSTRRRTTERGSRAGRE